MREERCGRISLDTLTPHGSLRLDLRYSAIGPEVVRETVLGSGFDTMPERQESPGLREIGTHGFVTRFLFRGTIKSVVTLPDGGGL